MQHAIITINGFGGGRGPRRMVNLMRKKLESLPII